MKALVIFLVLIPGMAFADPMNLNDAPASGSISTYGGGLYDHPSNWPFAVSFNVSISGNIATIRNVVAHNNNPAPYLLFFEMGTGVNLLSGSSYGSRCSASSVIGICYSTSDLTTVFDAYIAEWVVDTNDVNWQFGSFAGWSTNGFTAWNKGYYMDSEFKNAQNATLTLTDMPVMSSVPEPGALTLLAAGMLGIGFTRRKQRKSSLLFPKQ